MSLPQFYILISLYLDLHGLIFDMSICHRQDQPGCESGNKKKNKNIKAPPLKFLPFLLVLMYFIETPKPRVFQAKYFYFETPKPRVFQAKYFYFETPKPRVFQAKYFYFETPKPRVFQAKYFYFETPKPRVFQSKVKYSNLKHRSPACFQSKIFKFISPSIKKDPSR